MRGQYVLLEDVRPMVIALLQKHGPTDAVAEATGVPERFIRAIYSRSDVTISWPTYDKIEAEYEKISRGGNHHEIKA